MTPSTRKILIILAIALFLRVLLPVASLIRIGDSRAFRYPDSTSYLRPAEELLRAGRFADGQRPEIDRTPGYPLFLLPGLALGKPVLLTIGLQVLLSLLTVLLVYRTSLLAFGNERAASAAALLYSLEPLSILYSCLLLSETLFAFFIVAGGFFLARHLSESQAPGELLLAAVCLACSVYVRPVSYYLPVLLSLVLLPALLLRYRRTKYVSQVVLFLFVSLGLTAAWQVRNKVQTGYGGFSAISDVNLYFYQAASVRAKVEGRSYLEVRREMGYTAPELYFAEHPEQRAWSDAQRYEFMGREGKRMILRHPIVYAAIHLNGMVRILFDPGAVDFLKLFGFYPSSGGLLGELADRGLVSVALELLQGNPLVFWTQSALFVLLAATYVFAVLGLLGKNPSGVTLKIVFAVVIVYFIVVSAGPHSYSRFRHPLMPFLCLLAGCGLRRRAARIDSLPAIRDSDQRARPLADNPVRKDP